MRSSPSCLPIRTVQKLCLGLLLCGFCLAGVGCGLFGSSEPPAAPSGLEGVSGDAQVELSWEAVNEADTYNVYRSTSSSGVEGDPIKGNVPQTSATDASVENGTSYYYRVTAVDGDGNESDPSGELKVTPFANPPERP